MVWTQGVVSLEGFNLTCYHVYVAPRRLVLSNFAPSRLLTFSPFCPPILRSVFKARRRGNSGLWRSDLEEWQTLSEKVLFERSKPSHSQRVLPFLHGSRINIATR